MANTLRLAGFHGCPADPNVWMQKNTKPDGTEHWECILCHVDDVPAMSHDPKSTMDCLNTAHTLKTESVKALDKCLGLQIHKHNINGELDAWVCAQISM